jgi:hypothetical protein
LKEKEKVIFNFLKFKNKRNLTYFFKNQNFEFKDWFLNKKYKVKKKKIKLKKKKGFKKSSERAKRRKEKEKQKIKDPKKKEKDVETKKFKIALRNLYKNVYSWDGSIIKDRIRILNNRSASFFLKDIFDFAFNDIHNTKGKKNNFFSKKKKEFINIKLLNKKQEKNLQKEFIQINTWRAKFNLPFIEKIEFLNWNKKKKQIF